MPCGISLSYMLPTVGQEADLVAYLDAAVLAPPAMKMSVGFAVLLRHGALPSSRDIVGLNFISHGKGESIASRSRAGKCDDGKRPALSSGTGAVGLKHIDLLAVAFEPAIAQREDRQHEKIKRH